jgi:hypothetical protein
MKVPSKVKISSVWTFMDCMPRPSFLMLNYAFTVNSFSDDRVRLVGYVVG